MENYIHIWHSHINLDIYTHKIRNIFNNIINLNKILFKIQLVQHSKLGLFDGENLYKLQFVQPILYELQLVQTACTSCNLYRFLVQVATFTKSHLVHNIYKSVV